MDTKELAQTPARGRRNRLAVAALLVVVLTAASGVFVYRSMCTSPDTTEVKKTDPVGASWNYETVFPSWPKDKKPDFVIVLTGQTYGYLQKCGCSDPQKGGLERRFNFFEGFRAHGIECIPLDLGDVSPHGEDRARLVPAQAVLKYATAMRAMKAMGYKAVGLGKEEFILGLLDAIAAYSLQPKGDEPLILAANLISIGGTLKSMLPNGKGDPAVRDWEVIPTKDGTNVGVVAVVGDPVVQEIKKHDPQAVFAAPPNTNTPKVIQQSLDAMAKGKMKPKLNVLLYNGPFEVTKDEKGNLLKEPILFAQTAAKAFPEFQVLVCNSDEAEPPNAPVMFAHKNGQNTMIVRVGHKGQNIGVVGVFLDGKGGYDLKYQRVALTPEFETPAGKEKDNPALVELERYSKKVRDESFLARNRKVLHPIQAANAQAAYVGSDNCKNCHNGPVHGGVDNSWDVYAGSKHNTAYNALVNIAKKPSLREFDGECIRCHTVGYDFNTGFVDLKQTPSLINVGCESCHGPGSLHTAAPANKQFALQLSPWKVNPADKLPDPARMKQYAEENDPAKRQKILTPAEYATMLRVDRTCQTCHNVENDPHFKIESFWPKIAHGVQPPAKNGPNPAPMNPMVQQKEQPKADGPVVAPMPLPGPALPLPPN